MTVLATTRGDIADFVSAVILVYTIIIFIYPVPKSFFQQCNFSFAAAQIFLYS